MRVKTRNYLGVVRAFGGLEFVKNEWRDVPEGCEAEARRHPFLEIEQVEVEPVAVVAPPKTRKRQPARKRTPAKAKGDK